MKFFRNLNVKFTSVPQASISTHLFSDVQEYLNPQVRIKKMMNSVVCHRCPLGLSSWIYPFIFP